MKSNIVETLKEMIEKNQLELEGAVTMDEADKCANDIQWAFEVMKAELEKTKVRQRHALETMCDFIDAVMATPELTRLSDSGLPHMLKNLWTYQREIEPCDLTVN